MDHMPRRQAISEGDLGVAGLAAMEGAAFGEKLGSRGAMNGAVDAATPEQ
jgi:hypothetical protein